MNALRTTHHLETAQRLGVSHCDVRRSPAVLEKRVLGTDPGIVESSRDRVRWMHLTLRVLEQIAQGPVENARGPATQ